MEFFVASKNRRVSGALGMGRSLGVVGKVDISVAWPHFSQFCFCQWEGVII